MARTPLARIVLEVTVERRDPEAKYPMAGTSEQRNRGANERQDHPTGDVFGSQPLPMGYRCFT
jgi:hypothetical protein